jgi:hypothetical protein
MMPAAHLDELVADVQLRYEVPFELLVVYGVIHAVVIHAIE